jgi:hypothetical protein
MQKIIGGFSKEFNRGNEIYYDSRAEKQNFPR